MNSLQQIHECALMAQFTLPGMKYIGCIGTSSCVVGGEKPSYPCGSKAHFVCDCLQSAALSAYWKCSHLHLSCIYMHCCFLSDFFLFAGEWQRL